MKNTPTNDLLEAFPTIIEALARLHKLVNSRILGTGANPAENIELRRECIKACDQASDILDAARAALAKAI